MKNAKPPGRPFKPGQSGNPNGRPKTDPEVKALRRLTTEQMKQLGDSLVLGSLEELEALERDEQAPVLKRWVAKVILRGQQSGDMGTLEALLTRLIGKVTDSVEVRMPQPIVIERLDGTAVELTSVFKDDGE